jgi:hypothetical protein
MSSPGGAQETLESLLSATPEPQSCDGVSPKFFPFHALDDQPPKPQLEPLITRIHFEPDFASQLPAILSPLMKENIPPSASSAYGSPFFEPPSYDSFFSALQKPLNSSPTSYDGLWSSSSFLLNRHPTISPTGSTSTLLSSAEPSISPVSAPSSIRHSSSPLLDSATSYSSFGTPQLRDISMDTVNRVQLSPSKRKILSEYLLAYPTPSTEFDEPDPKRIKIIDSELPISDKLDKVFNLFADLGWRTDTFMHHFFVKDDANPRSHRHSVFLELVLNGKGGHFLADILNAWWMASAGDDPSDDTVHQDEKHTSCSVIVCCPNN